MVRTELRTASEALREAAAATDEPDREERLYELSLDLADLATAESGPDHGRLARVEHSIRDAAEGADEAVTAAVDRAVEAVRRHREGVEGV